MTFTREECEYTKFSIENHKLGFGLSGIDDEYILISIPFTDNTPECIKDKLNDVIYQEMNKYLNVVESMPMPCGLKLNANMQIQCCNDEEIEPQYYISIIITDMEADFGTWIEKSINVSSEIPEFQDEFILYCQEQVNRLLFPERGVLRESRWIMVDIEDLRKSNYLKKELCENCMKQLNGVLDDEQLEKFEKSFYEAMDNVILERRQ